MSASTRRPPSLAEVAARAGVSHQTVSRVVNEFPGVRPDTRERVQEAIAELGYRRNNAARTLVTRKSGLIGVIAVGSFLYGPTSTLAAIEHISRERGYTIVLATLRTGELDALTAMVDSTLSRGVEALVVIASREALVRHCASLKTGVPLVVVGPRPQGLSGVTTLAVDQREGARLAMDHLLELGHRDVVLVSGPADWVDAQDRLEAAAESCAAVGVTPRIIMGDWSAESGHAIAEELIASGKLPTAVFAANDQMALGLLASFNEHGVSIPQQVSVVGFDNVAGSEFFTPALTTVHQDFNTLGRKVLDATVSLIEGDEPDLSLVSAELVVRRSTSSPGQSAAG